MTLPEWSGEAELAALGVRIVDTVVSDDLRLIFRPKERADLGIDAEIETVILDPNGKRRGSGRIIAVQIKCGKSFFSEEKDEHYVYRGELKHLHYWLSFSVPVLIVICHPDTREAFWAEIKPSLIERTAEAWKIAVPKAQRLCNSVREIKNLARRSYLQANMELAAKVWFFEMNSAKVDFAGDFGIPRDFYGFDHICSIGGDLYLLAWIVARYGRFEPEDLEGVIARSHFNKVYADQMFIGLIAEHPSAFEFSDRWTASFKPHVKTNVAKLLFNRSTSQVGLLNEDGEVDVEYHTGSIVYSESWESFLSYDNSIRTVD